jgi:hypothetical protein
LSHRLSGKPVPTFPHDAPGSEPGRARKLAGFATGHGAAADGREAWRASGAGRRSAEHLMRLTMSKSRIRGVVDEILHWKPQAEGSENFRRTSDICASYSGPPPRIPMKATRSFRAGERPLFLEGEGGQAIPLNVDTT